MAEYQSIKSDVIRQLSLKLPEMRNLFKIESIGIFGSVARGDDTPKSDIDILFSFQKNEVSIRRYLALAEYLENLFLKKVDLLHSDNLNPRLQKAIDAEVIWAHA